MDLTIEIYRLVKLLPKEEMYALSDQLRRSVVSIPSNIAEGHGRESSKEFVHFLSIARGSHHEVETQLEICKRLNLITLNDIETSKLLVVEISKMINSLITYLKTKNQQLITNN
ncbi:MAG: four helix bundle protein [Lachnoclostridium sp.]|nr:four helix bundle protein [Lachnoclostridium sp.]